MAQATLRFEVAPPDATETPLLRPVCPPVFRFYQSPLVELSNAVELLRKLLIGRTKGRENRFQISGWTREWIERIRNPWTTRVNETGQPAHGCNHRLAGESAPALVFITGFTVSASSRRGTK